MRICVPTEVKNNEFRVALTPAGVHELVRAGHEVYVQRGAGEGSSMTDAEYTAAGATILDDAAEVWARADIAGSVSSACFTGGVECHNGAVSRTTFQRENLHTGASLAACASLVPRPSVKPYDR